MKDRIKQAFPNALQNNCIVEIQHTYFEVFDPASEDATNQTICHIVQDTDTGHFQVNNPNAKFICFSPVDNCIFQDSSHQKCDFILFDDSIFCFADIKNVSTKSRKNARRDAKDQMEATITLFISKIDFSAYTIKAIIAFTAQKTYPLAKVSTQDAKIRFEDKFNAQLYEGNSISFV